MDVYKVGTKVLLHDSEDVEATIVTVAIHSGDYVQYECSWWAGHARSREWFHSDEFEVVDKNKRKVKIGFCNA